MSSLSFTIYSHNHCIDFTAEVIAQTYDTKVFRETKDNKKYQISTNREVSDKRELRLESLPQSVDTLEVCDKAAARYATILSLALFTCSAIISSVNFLRVQFLFFVILCLMYLCFH